MMLPCSGKLLRACARLSQLLDVVSVAAAARSMPEAKDEATPAISV